MKKIQMVDLKSQYEKIKTTVDASIQEVLDTTTYINGPKVHEFQKNLEEYLNVKHVIPCANGTDALQIAMMALDLKPGDEVITADFTFAATVEVIALLQLTPVLVDVDVVNIRKKIGMVFQKSNPFPKSIYENVAYGPKINGIKDKTQLDEIVETSLRQAAIWDEVKDRLYTNVNEADLFSLAQNNRRNSNRRKNGHT